MIAITYICTEEIGFFYLYNFALSLVRSTVQIEMRMRTCGGKDVK